MDNDPVVLLHAFPLHSGMWDALRVELGDGLRVVTPDMPGFGDAPLASAAPSLDVCADAIAGLLDQEGIQEATIGGLSMGGYIALAFARRHPQRVRALILADTKAAADTAAAVANRLRIADAVTTEQSTRVLIDELLPNLLGATTKSQRPSVVAAVRAMVESASPAAVAWAQRAMAARIDTVDVLEDLTVPVLVLVGEEDVVTPPADADVMFAATAQSAADGRAQLVTLPAAGHLSAIEEPAAFAAAVRAFLAGL